ncbi:response regulator transcription factor [Streptomyces sp. NA02950]|uniref:response regulator transcription factor n=1 Tax=Streptomyces sp. NA02950 TaxID=2742137 RepID=UPI0015923771|nr:response regulator transcription factor [Streptomyces sp. NA02950]QKV95226.1 response regulator transcription factor [Streptomyces sp. NA02950]
MIRVLLVHDSCLLRSALATLIRAEPGIDVTASSWRDARSRARSLQPHVCVMDTDCTGYDGPGRRGELKKIVSAASGDHGACELLVLATAGRPGPLRRAHEAQALGYIDKDAPPQRLLDGIRQVANKQRFVDDSLGYGFLQAAEIPLTQRELGVLSLAAGGASIAEIARTLHLSNGTIRNYLAAITRKTGARNRVDAIRISHAEGWV